jgi:hypothetical protein
MLYRVEVSPSRSQGWPWFVRLAKRFKSYKVTRDEDLEIHSIETRSVRRPLRDLRARAQLEGLGVLCQRPAGAARGPRAHLPEMVAGAQPGPARLSTRRPRDRPDLPFRAMTPKPSVWIDPVRNRKGKITSWRVAWRIPGVGRDSENTGPIKEHAERKKRETARAGMVRSAAAQGAAGRAQLRRPGGALQDRPRQRGLGAHLADL